MTLLSNERERGISYSYISTGRFKTTLISVGFYLPLDEDASANALTLSLLKSGTESLPDTYSLNRRLAGLYGACVYSSVSKYGDYQELRIGVTVNDDKYSLNGEHTVDEAGQLLCDMIFGRFLSKTDYPAESIDREKRLLCEEIAGKLNDKRTYARERCEEIMCSDEPYGLSPQGTEEKVKSLNAQDISRALDRIIRKAFISVQVIGEKEPAQFAESFSKCILSANREYEAFAPDIIKSAGELKTFEEKMPVKQGKLVIGLRSENGGGDRETVANWVMCDVFGGGPYSKLFCNVREKMSLCYYCSARSVRRKGLILIDSGVEESNISAAKDAISAQLADMAAGNFSDKEVNSSKLALCDMIRSVESDQAALARWYAARAMEEKPATPEEICELISKVTAEDIKNAALGFKADTVYILRPDGSVKETEE